MRSFIIAPHFDDDNCGVLLALAATNSTRDLQIAMDGGDPVPGSKAILLYLSPEDNAHFVKAILAHGGKSEGGTLYYKEAALMAIIAAAEEAGK